MISLKEPIIIAIDGFSSCGKSSFAKLIAKETAYTYIDSGAMYRAVTFFAHKENLVNEQGLNREKLTAELSGLLIEFRSIEGKVHTYLNGENIESEIRGIGISGLVSIVSKIPEVRECLVQQQQRMGEEKAVVMDGRDIGTVVFPEAEVKIFMQASVEVRARRRYDELQSMNKTTTYKEVFRNIEERDFNDLNRDVSPLKKANDAEMLDNSFMTFEEQMKWFVELLNKKDLLK